MLKERRMRPAIASRLSILILFGAPTISHALSCAPGHFTLNEAYEAADSIIVGLITGCREEISRDPWTNGGSNCSFSSIEVLKESTPARDYSGITSSSGCGLTLQVGDQYLLFLDSKNEPMHFSAALGGDQAQLANRYLQIIRDFKNGVANELAEPWMVEEADGHCSIWHSVRGNQIRFSRRTVDAPRQPKPNWIQETTNGITVYRTTVPTYEADSRSPAGNAEIVAFGDIPDYPDDALMLSVHLQEASPHSVRQATLSVGSKTWSLKRVEMSLSLQGVAAGTVIDYYAAGDVAEQILSAMAKPSDIVVSATVVPSNLDSALPEVLPSDQESFERAPSEDVYLGQAAPEASSPRPAVTPNVRAAGSYGAQEEPPQPVLRVESRSTHLSGVIEGFRACAAGDE